MISATEAAWKARTCQNFITHLTWQVSHDIRNGGGMEGEKNGLKHHPAPLLHVLRKVTWEVGRNEFEAKNISYSSWLVRKMG